MSEEKINKAYEDAINQIEKELREFKEKLRKGTSNPDDFMTLSEIEKEWASLKDTTNKTYSDMVSAYLSEIDERDLIKSKKENSKERGSD